MESTSVSFRPYDQDLLETILTHPEMARKNVWWLFTTYFWNRLKDEMYDIETDGQDIEDMVEYDDYELDGQLIAKDDLRMLLEGSVDDFMAAAESGLTIRICDKPYRIPKNENLSADILKNKIFRFGSHGDLMAVITKQYIQEPYDKNEMNTVGKERKDSRMFFKKLVWLVDNTDEGWDNLTDIEAAAYTWGIKMAKYEGKYVREVSDIALKTFDYIDRKVAEFTPDELTDCWIDDYTCAMVSIDTQFSARKMLEWAEANGQKSIVSRIPDNKADDYWYIKGLKTFF